MVSLAPMSQAQYEAYMTVLLQDYAAEHVRGGRWTAAEAPEEARAELGRLLPEGSQTADHFFCNIVDDAASAVVGRIWYWRDAGRNRLFLYDIVIDEKFRRRGLAAAALAELESVAQRLGADEIGLHVFGHNHAARALYEQLGYEVTNVMMRKRVASA